MALFRKESVYQEHSRLVEHVSHDSQHPDHLPLAEVQICDLGILELSVALHLKDFLVDLTDLLGLARLRGRFLSEALELSEMQGRRIFRAYVHDFLEEILLNSLHFRRL